MKAKGAFPSHRITAPGGWSMEPEASSLIGESAAIRTLRERIRVAARGNRTVLIEGETGSGKELVAREIHRQSRRADQRLVIVDCSAIPENLLESELFGHGKGAFTGAVASYGGRIQESHRGTLFFDEIGSISLSVQAKLLRFLETGEFPRVRESGLRRVDARVITATSQYLRDGIGVGQIRKDFYYRLSATCIWVPPLRDRIEDIPLIVADILRKEGAGTARLHPRAMGKLMAHDWPGNVRELKNTVLASLDEHDGEPILDVSILPSPPCNGSDESAPDDASGQPKSLRSYIETKEREYLSKLVLGGNGKLAQLAATAGVSVRTLQRKLRYHSLHY